MDCGKEHVRKFIARLLGQLHGYSHRFQEGLGQAVKIMRENAAAKTELAP